MTPADNERVGPSRGLGGRRWWHAACEELGVSSLVWIVLGGLLMALISLVGAVTLVLIPPAMVDGRALDGVGEEV